MFCLRYIVFIVLKRSYFIIGNYDEYLMLYFLFSFLGVLIGIYLVLKVVRVRDVEIRILFCSYFYSRLFYFCEFDGDWLSFLMLFFCLKFWLKWRLCCFFYFNFMKVLGMRLFLF